jgi:hypothetical protein
MGNKLCCCWGQCPSLLLTVALGTTSQLRVSAGSMSDPVLPLLQGESDAGIFDEAPGYRVYGRLLVALLASWRQRLQQPALPFVIVQVLHHSSGSCRTALGSWAVLRV